MSVLSAAMENVYYSCHEDNNQVDMPKSSGQENNKEKPSSFSMDKKWLLLISLLGNMLALVAVGVAVGLHFKMQTSLAAAEQATSTSVAKVKQGITNTENATSVNTNMTSNVLSTLNSEINKTNLQLDNLKLRMQTADCSRIFKNQNASGIFEIYLLNDIFKGINVMCDNGWTIFQQRVDGSVNFYRGWSEYVAGFGDPQHDYWLGLETLHQMTKGGEYMLKVQLQGRDGEMGEGTYQTFIVGDATSKYKLTVNGFQGTIGDSLLVHNGMAFSTFDQDNDLHAGVNCASVYHGAWWYQTCHQSNLNGKYNVAEATGAVWSTWKKTYNALISTKMMIKKK